MTSLHLDDDQDNNPSSNPSFEGIARARLSRRGLLRGAAGTAGAALMGSALTACGSDGDGGTSASPASGGAVRPAALAFNPVDRSLEDIVTIPAGYTATVVYRLGDPLSANVAPYRNDGTEPGESFALRGGDHHDGMHYFGLGADGRYSATASDRALLVVNHESITPRFLHAGGAQSRSGTGVAQVRTVADEVVKEMNAHGVGVVEIEKVNGTWRYRQASPFNRRVTPSTPMELSGPARGSALMVTKYSPDGTRTRGTVNNCANGYTPWGTYLACEENWAGYFRRIAATDNPNRTAKELASFARYGVAGNGNHLWATATPDTAEDMFGRWNAEKRGASANGSDDYRNAPNTFGWNVEIDPFAPASVPRKRTAMGRFAHEGAWPAKVEAGKPIVYYMGCDSRNEYIYKYVSNAAWDPADANRGLAAGDKYLDDGKLYAARFNEDGTGQWIELRFGLGNVTAAYAPYAFADQADVLINARHAAGAVGATRMDRPEWGAVNPVNGEVYLTLTNSASTPTSTSRRTAAMADAANPRVYDQRDSGPNPTHEGNINGHIIRWKEPTPEAATFTWDVYLFGARATDDPANINLSGLTVANDLSSPDGLWFSEATKLLWIQTDDGYFTDTTNCMMLAALPGTVGDGTTKTVLAKDSTGQKSVQTRVGKSPTDTELRRFLVGPRECEITGVAESPDGRSLFVNIQHPGEDRDAVMGDPTSYGSTWPADALPASATIKGTGRPRSATIVITRNDGGLIGA